MLVLVPLLRRGGENTPGERLLLYPASYHNERLLDLMYRLHTFIIKTHEGHM